MTPTTDAPTPTAAALEIRGTAPGLLAPEFDLPRLADSETDAERLSFADLPGAPTVLSFWTTWCPYCRRQTPVLVDASSRYANVRFVGIDVKEDATLVRSYVEDNQIPYAIALDTDGAVAEEFMVRGFPTTYFLDAEGRVVARHVGQLTTELLDDYLNRFPTTD
ncbi:MAG: TlpA disulfide reductase family protein [Caldilineaceae bacterium]